MTLTVYSVGEAIRKRGRVADMVYNFLVEKQFGDRNHNPRVGGSSPSSATNFQALTRLAPKRFTNFVNQLRLEADRGLAVPSCSHVFGARYQAKIRPAVIERVAVDMVNMPISGGIQYEPMKHDPLTSDVCGDVGRLSAPIVGNARL